MALLRRVLYWEAAVLTAGGVLLAVAPRFVLVTLMDQFPARDYAWVRIGGVQAVGFAMFMVLVGHNVEDRWLWSWAFVIVLAGVTAIEGLNAAFSIPAHSAAWPWSVLAAVDAALAGLLIIGIARAGIERPPDIKPE